MSSDLKTEISEEIECFIRSGFFDQQKTEQAIQDMFLGEIIDQVWLHEQIEDCFHRNLTRQQQWPEKMDFDRLVVVFDQLNLKKIIALHAPGYTRQDGESDCWEMHTNLLNKDITTIGYCFYHMQDVAHALQSSARGLLLAFGSYPDSESEAVKIGHIIVDELRAQGFEVEWDKTAEKRIWIKSFAWQKRLDNQGNYVSRAIDLLSKSF